MSVRHLRATGLRIIPAGDDLRAKTTKGEKGRRRARYDERLRRIQAFASAGQIAQADDASAAGPTERLRSGCRLAFADDHEAVGGDSKR
jgi:hypothetical protein